VREETQGAYIIYAKYAHVARRGSGDFVKPRFRDATVPATDSSAFKRRLAFPFSRIRGIRIQIFGTLRETAAMVADITRRLERRP
jgi:hypothetical protein